MKKISSDMLLWITALGFFMQSLDTTVVNSALPAMARSFGADPMGMQVVSVSYSLTMATLLPTSGWLADRFGTRQVYFSALVIFCIGSLFCAMSTSVDYLVVSRVIQGMGGAMLLPVGRIAVLRAYPRERLLQAMSFVTLPGLIGPLLGPTVGGWLSEFASWHWIFLINIPIGMLGCTATLMYMSAADARSARRFDLAGYLLLAVAMLSMSLCLNGLGELAMPRNMVFILLLCGLGCIFAYRAHMMKDAMPLFPPDLFKTPTFSVGLLGNLVARTGSSSIPFLLPLLLQVGLRYTPLYAGMMMIPVAAAGIAAKTFVTSLVDRFGYRKILIMNTVLVGLGITSFAFIGPRLPFWLLLAQLFLFGSVNSMQFTVMYSLTLKDLEDSLASSGSSVLSLVMMLSASFGVALGGGLLTTIPRAFPNELGIDPEVAFHASFACMGCITAASAWIFWKLPAKSGVEGCQRRNATVAN